MDANKSNVPNGDTLGANETDEINDGTYAHGPAGPCYLGRFGDRLPRKGDQVEDHSDPDKNKSDQSH